MVKLLKMVMYQDKLKKADTSNIANRSIFELFVEMKIIVWIGLMSLAQSLHSSQVPTKHSYPNLSFLVLRLPLLIRFKNSRHLAKESQDIAVMNESDLIIEWVICSVDVERTTLKAGYLPLLYLLQSFGSHRVIRIKIKKYCYRHVSACVWFDRDVCTIRVDAVPSLPIVVRFPKRVETSNNNSGGRLNDGRRLQAPIVLILLG
uniref:Uncharacterized protein n=1 Tax=Glossina austeni TaxID=7395 RepID=A0A1A9US88_GLOAU